MESRNKKNKKRKRKPRGMRVSYFYVGFVVLIAHESE